MLVRRKRPHFSESWATSMPEGGRNFPLSQSERGKGKLTGVNEEVLETTIKNAKAFLRLC